METKRQYSVEEIKTFLENNLKIDIKIEGENVNITLFLNNHHLYANYSNINKIEHIMMIEDIKQLKQQEMSKNKE